MRVRVRVCHGGVQGGLTSDRCMGGRLARSGQALGMSGFCVYAWRGGGGGGGGGVLLSDGCMALSAEAS